MRLVRDVAAVLGVVGALALAGCLHGDKGDSSERQPVTPSRTVRPELAFFTTRGGGIYDLGVADDRGRSRDVLTGESRPGTVFPQLFTRLSWSPDGQQISFAGVQGPQTDAHDEPTDIYRIDADGSNVDQITDVGDARDPLWSPDGETIVFTRTSLGDSEPPRGHLWSVKIDGSGLTEIVEAEGWEIYTAGSFTPDSSRLAVTRSVYHPETLSENATIEIMSPDGSGAERLIDDATDPAFSPDGARIAFASGRDRNGELCYGDRCFWAGELYVSNADGSEPERLTETEALNEADPSWLPDGLRIAYQRGEVFQNAEATEIWETNDAGTCSRAILAGSGNGAWYASPAWRPSEPREGGGLLRC